MRFTKDPNATLDYLLSWLDWLGPDRISFASWILPAAPDNLTIDSSNVNTAQETITLPIYADDGVTIVGTESVVHPAATFTTAWISGGSVGKTYKVTCRVTTLGGRIDDRALSITIREK